MSPLNPPQYTAPNEADEIIRRIASSTMMEFTSIGKICTLCYLTNPRHMGSQKQRQGLHEDTCPITLARQYIERQEQQQQRYTNDQSWQQRG